jgi:Transposase DDE domain
VQGYNVQVVASPEQVILAAEVSQSHNDGDQLAPMVATAREALRGAGIEDPIGTVLAERRLLELAGDQRDPQPRHRRARPTQDRRRSKPRKLSPRQGDEARRIEAALATPEGKALYRRRQQIVEPVFANTKVIRRADRFLRRGLVAWPGRVAANRRDAQPLKALARSPGNRLHPKSAAARRLIDTARPRARSIKPAASSFPPSPNGSTAAADYARQAQVRGFSESG